MPKKNKGSRVSVFVGLVGLSIGCTHLPQTSLSQPDLSVGQEDTKFRIASEVGPLCVSTVAGNGFSGFANGNGTAARFSIPRGLAIDSSGILYIADTGNSTIRKIDLSGNVTTFAGNGTFGYADGNGTAARFSGPWAVAVDTSGNVYVADTGNQRIRKIEPDGDVTTLAGSGTAGFQDGNGTTAQFWNPRGIAVDSSGNVYVADTFNNRIRKIEPDGDVTTLAGSGTSGFLNGNGTTARFADPSGVAVDSSGNVYVGDDSNSRIRKIEPDGDVTTFAGSGTPGFQDGSSTTAQFRRPVGVAVDAAGRVYVGEFNNHAVRQIEPDGTVSTLAGSTIAAYVDGDAATARFNDPTGVVVNSSGIVFVADGGNHSIRRIGPCNELPLIECPGDIVAEATSSDGAVVTFEPTATDPDGGTVGVDSSPASGSTFALGVTEVAVTATDDENSIATCAFNVTVQDTTDPLIACPGDQTVTTSNPNGTAVALPDATATDIADPSPDVQFVGAPSVFPWGTTTVTAKATDDSDNFATCQFNVTVKLQVPIDVMPGTSPNRINRGAKGTLPVAILSTSVFDATQVNPATVTLAGASVAKKPKNVLQASRTDANRDGRLDWLLQFNYNALQVNLSTTQLVMQGETFAGKPVTGADAVQVVK